MITGIRIPRVRMPKVPPSVNRAARWNRPANSQKNARLRATEGLRCTYRVRVLLAGRDRGEQGSPPARRPASIVPDNFLHRRRDGIAWAAALGRHMAGKICSNRSDFDAEFDPKRYFTVGPALQHRIGKPAAFALSHGIVKLRR